MDLENGKSPAKVKTLKACRRNSDFVSETCRKRQKLPNTYSKKPLRPTGRPLNGDFRDVALLKELPKPEPNSPKQELPSFKTYNVAEICSDYMPDSPNDIPLHSFSSAQEHTQAHRIISQQPKCPMCGEAVDASYLKNYNNGRTMKLRTQVKFCRAHRKESAKTEWVMKRYPKIDWTTLDARVTEHHTFIQTLLDGAYSYYRAALDKDVSTGKNRTLAQATMDPDMTLTPGYYGCRGLRIISENIMDRFSPQLRKIAVKDRLVSARGVAGYVEAVLVPELAVRFICEDMKVGTDEARQIMSESAKIGDLLNEDTGDIIILQEGDNCTRSLSREGSCSSGHSDNGSWSMVTNSLKVVERADLAIKLNMGLTRGQGSTRAGTGSDVANPITIPDDDE